MLLELFTVYIFTFGKEGHHEKPKWVVKLGGKLTLV